ncbi:MULTISPECIES: hypothetical protein [Exiguobacterium]|uniref:hypothetical protein n=1 Tax=Exiguobacterium sp. UBA1053 TaxID=1946487 RepID=UPI0025BC0F06|nr:MULTISPECIES: hypothetical protein [Exiguobacterium]
MNFTRGKVFSRNNNIEVLNYNLEDDYYSFIKKNSEKGYEQVILTTDFMLAILKYYFIDRKFTIKEIIPVDEEGFLVSKFESYIERIEEDRDQFLKLLEEMDFLFYEKNALDIFKMELSGKNKFDERIRLNVQINGIINIKESCYEEEKENIRNVILTHFGWKQ